MRQLIKGEDYYVTDDGLYVFTEKYLLARGHCCGNGCKHCPFDFKNVPEPKRTTLLKLRDDKNNIKDR